MTDKPEAAPSPAGATAPVTTVQDSGLTAGRDVHQSGRYVAGRDLSVVLPQRTAVRALSQLPPAVELVGRAAELAALTRPQPAGDATRVAVVRDGAGVGKSALAIGAAHRMTEQYPDAHLYLKLGGENLRTLSTAAALQHLLWSLGVGESDIPEDLERRVALYRSTIAEMRAVIVLDDAESAQQVAPLIPASQAYVFITSRRQTVGLQGAHVVDLTRLSEDAAMELLEREIGAERCAAEPRAALDVVRACGCLPLAVQLASSALNSPSGKRRSLTTFARRLAEEGRRHGAFDTEVRAGFALSYRTLSPTAARVFRAQGLVAATSLGVPCVAALTGLDEADVEEAQDELLDAYLAEPSGPDGDRFHLHDLLRRFAREQALDEDGVQECGRATARLRAWALAFATDNIQALHSPDTTEADRARRRLDAEGAVLVAVVEQSTAQSGGAADAVALALSLEPWFEAGSHYEAWRRAYESALNHAVASGDEACAVRLLLGLGDRSRLLRDHAGAEHRLADALHRAQDLGQPQLVGQAHFQSGMLLRERGRYDEAISHLSLAVDALTGEDSHALAQSHNNLGHTLRRLKRYEEAAVHLRRAAAIAARLGDRTVTGWATANLLASLRAQNRLTEAEACYRPGLAAFEAVGHRLGQAWMHCHLGAVRALQQRWPQAVELFTRAVDEFTALDDAYGLSAAYGGLADAHRAQGDLGQAATLFARAADRAEQAGDAHRRALAALCRLTTLQDLGDAAPPDRVSTAESAAQAAVAALDEPQRRSALRNPRWSLD
ncbi:tetratricopeptide repeat protein [Streptomyces sp. NPDC006516]|uniref:tetratricopeptide repeat protein n=1 Tax=Streptomyces sp. NPDC006516 TaxID=3154309 RepID=UPI0033B4AEC5